MKPYRPISPQEGLRHARRHGYAIGAFNVSSFSVLKAIISAATRLRSPVIIETSGGETAFMGAGVQAAMVNAFEQRARIPVFLNLDHSKTFRDVHEAIEMGYEMVHFDGSELPKATNIRILSRVVREAHRRGICVEGELDHITGSSLWHRRTRMERMQRKGHYTDPAEAEAFVRATGIDIFAPFVGNVHGVFANEERLDFMLLQELVRRLPCSLSLHGGSGIDARDVRRAIRTGIVKVNVNTELRIAYMAALRKVLKRHPQEIVPYQLMPEVITAVQKVVERMIRLFGSAGYA